jgi:hypothetical protein
LAAFFSSRLYFGAGVKHPEKITLGKRREMGIRGLLVYCLDYKCSQNVEISADQWPDHVRLSDLEPSIPLRCGRKGAEVRADFNWVSKQNRSRRAWAGNVTSQLALVGMIFREEFRPLIILLAAMALGLVVKPWIRWLADWVAPALFARGKSLDDLRIDPNAEEQWAAPLH